VKLASLQYTTPHVFGVTS